MYSSDLIAKEEHQEWWRRTESNPDVCYLVFEYLGRPVGLAYFTNIDTANGKCEWGFYLGETDVPRGTGTVMGFMALNHIFSVRATRKVYGTVLGFNAASRKFFLRLGFQQDGVLRQHVLKEGEYVDVVLFSLLADEWVCWKNSDKFTALFGRNREEVATNIYSGTISKKSCCSSEGTSQTGASQVTNVIATSRAWHQGMAQRLSQQTGEPFDLISDKKELTLDYLRELSPTYVFFPHWSYLIPSDIYEQFECVIFHMTDVPFGRGGSPLQNLISRGIYETQMTALKCVKELDAGPVYMKRPFSLHGDAEQIYIRSGSLIETMIAEFIKTKPSPQAQTGKAVTFKRRRPEQSTIESVDRLDKLYDHIRMLDAEGYPSAFLKSGRFRLEFGRASMKQGRIVAEVVIKEQADE
jgi:methionyl-tRNA formyltransferase